MIPPRYQAKTFCKRQGTLQSKNDAVSIYNILLKLVTITLANLEKTVYVCIKCMNLPMYILVTPAVIGQL